MVRFRMAEERKILAKKSLVTTLAVANYPSEYFSLLNGEQIIFLTTSFSI